MMGSVSQKRRKRLNELQAMHDSVDTNKKHFFTLSRFLIFSLVITVLLLLFWNSQFQSTMQEKFIQQYQSSMQNAENLLTKCKNSTFDYDGNYRNVIGELGTARAMLALMQEPQTSVLAVNDLYTASIKLPNQMKLHLTEILAALDEINKGDTSQGYANLDKVIKTFNLQDY